MHPATGGGQLAKGIDPSSDTHNLPRRDTTKHKKVAGGTSRRALENLRCPLGPYAKEDATAEHNVRTMESEVIINHIADGRAVGG